MRINVLHVRELDARALHCHLQAVGHAFALRVRRGYVERVAICGIPCELAVDFRPALQRVLLSLEEKDARALAHHKPRALGVERSAARLRVFGAV